jgi:hypothetical protein
VVAKAGGSEMSLLKISSHLGRFACVLLPAPTHCSCGPAAFAADLLTITIDRRELDDVMIGTATWWKWLLRAKREGNP